MVIRRRLGVSEGFDVQTDALLLTTRVIAVRYIGLMGVVGAYARRLAQTADEASSVPAPPYPLQRAEGTRCAHVRRRHDSSNRCPSPL